MTAQSEVTCAACLKSIVSGGFVQSAQGKWFHLACHSGIQRFENIKEWDRASPSDTVCAACSKPIRLGTLALFEHGEWFHVGCRASTVFDVPELGD